MSDNDTDTDDKDSVRNRLPDEVYVAEANFVKLSTKKMTARRLVGWLREYAEYAEVSGDDKTAEHARHVADKFALELPDESPGNDAPKCHECTYPLGEDWIHRQQRAKENGTHPADCPNCGENPLPPVGSDT